MKLFVKYILISILFLINCKGQNKNEKNCTNEEQAIEVISKLKEVKQHQRHLDSISHHKKGISYIVDDTIINNKDYFQVKIGYNGELHWETYQIFYVSKSNCNVIYVDDVISGEIITLEKWRNINKQANNNSDNMNTKERLFSSIFIEGEDVNFTPQELNNLAAKNENIKKIKDKLELLDTQKPTSDDFSVNDLSLLINNETFTNSETYIDSSWLNYFLSKYKIDHEKIRELMTIAINQEDLKAVNIFINNNYIVSQKDLKTAEEREEYSEQMVEINKKNRGIDERGDPTFYDDNYSTIKEIRRILKYIYNLNMISDPDGYTNLRKERNTQSEILQQIKSGEKIEVLNNEGSWWLVKTKEGKQGYIYIMIE
jgi:hypothetical protein